MAKKIDHTLHELVDIAEETYKLYLEKYHLNKDEIEEVGNLIWHHLVPRLSKENN